MNRTTLLIATATLCSNVASAEIITVGGAGDQFGDIVPAIAAAQDGDTILVGHKSIGSYGPISIDDKSLTIMPKNPGGRFRVDSVRITNISAGEQVFIRGVDARSSSSIPGLLVIQCQGAVRFDDCSFAPNAPVTNRIFDSSNVVIENSIIPPGGESGLAGLWIRDSSVGLYSCSITGASGQFNAVQGGPGGEGVLRSGGGSLFLSNSEVTGGRGGDSGFLNLGVGGMGGDALVSLTGGTAVVVDCSLIPGISGTGAGGDQGPGTTGSGFNTVPGTGRQVQLRDSILDTKPIVLTFTGEPGDVVEYAYTEMHGFAPHGLRIGPEWIDSNTGSGYLPAGVIPLSGELEYTTHMGFLPPQETTQRLVQARITDTSGTVFLSNAAFIVIYDECTGVVPIGERYCSPAIVNSLGIPVELNAYGSDCTRSNSVFLVLTGLPHFEFGMFLASRGQDFVPTPGGSLGVLCLGGGQLIGRYNQPNQVQQASPVYYLPGGYIQLNLNLNEIPNPMSGTEVALVNQTWNFQAWYRDGGQSNFSDAISLRLR